MEKTIAPDQLDERKPYSKPEILHELELETLAGSPGGPTLIDPDENQSRIFQIEAGYIKGLSGICLNRQLIYTL